MKWEWCGVLYCVDETISNNEFVLYILNTSVVLLTAILNTTWKHSTMESIELNGIMRIL